MSRTSVGVLISGTGTNLQALIDACAQPGFPARIAVVVADRPRAGGLHRAERSGIPTAVLLRRDAPDQEAYERALVERLNDHEVRWVALAGFMRLVGPTFLEAFPHRVLNIHPSLLPAFPGLQAQRQAHAYGVRVSGATVHLVDEGTDTGPIVIQGVVPVLPGDDDEALRERILSMEHRIYPIALRWAVEGRLRVEGRRVNVELHPGETTCLM